MIYEQNLDALKSNHPESFAYLNSLSSSYKIDQDAGVISQDINRWKMRVDSEAFNLDAVGFILFGLGSGQEVRQLIASISPTTPILIFDSQGELTLEFFKSFDLTDILKHPALSYIVNKSENLPPFVHQYLGQKKDLLQVQWWENSLICQIATFHQDLFLHNVFRQYKAYVESGTLQHQKKNRMVNIETLYNELTPQSNQVYSTYPISCAKGCNECCYSGVGIDICVRPVEWEYAHHYIVNIMPEKTRKKKFREVLNYLIKNSHYLELALNYFDEHMADLDSEFHSKNYYDLTAELRNDPCPLLDDEESCQVYSHRFLPCRTYGNSYVFDKPLTCGLDREMLYKVVMDERQKHILVNFQEHQEKMSKVNEFYPYGHIMYVWLFTHLDLENKDFYREARLDYQQFQVFVNYPELFKERLSDLKHCAESL